LYIKEERDSPRREDYYAAQIAASVARVLSKNPHQIRMEDYLLKFTTETETPTAPATPPTEEEIEMRVNRSKAFWGALVAAGTRNKPRKGKGV